MRFGIGGGVHRGILRLEARLPALLQVRGGRTSSILDRAGNSPRPAALPDPERPWPAPGTVRDPLRFLSHVSEANCFDPYAADSRTAATVAVAIDHRVTRLAYGPPPRQVSSDDNADEIASIPDEAAERSVREVPGHAFGEPAGVHHEPGNTGCPELDKTREECTAAPARSVHYR